MAARAEELPAADELHIAKFWAADGGQRVVHAAQHLHGGIGVDLDYPVHRYFRWAKVIELTLGTATEHLLRLGRADRGGTDQLEGRRQTCRARNSLISGGNKSMKRYRGVALAVVLVLLSAVVQPERKLSAESSSSPGPGRRRLSVGGDTALANGGFGDLSKVCTRGGRQGRADKGVTDTDIHIGTVTDKGFPARSGLNKEMYDGADRIRQRGATATAASSVASS